MHLHPEVQSSRSADVKQRTLPDTKVVCAIKLQSAVKDTARGPPQRIGCSRLSPGVGEVIEDVVLDQNLICVRGQRRSDIHPGRLRIHAIHIRFSRIIPVKRVVKNLQTSGG